MVRTSSSSFIFSVGHHTRGLAVMRKKEEEAEEGGICLSLPAPSEKRRRLRKKNSQKDPTKKRVLDYVKFVSKKFSGKPTSPTIEITVTRTKHHSLPIPPLPPQQRKKCCPLDPDLDLSPHPPTSPGKKAGSKYATQTVGVQRPESSPGRDAN